MPLVRGGGGRGGGDRDIPLEHLAHLVVDEGDGARSGSPNPPPIAPPIAVIATAPQLKLFCRPVATPRPWLAMLPTAPAAAPAPRKITYFCIDLIK